MLAKPKPKPKWTTKFGFRVRRGGRLDKWIGRNQKNLTGSNPAPIKKKDAPVHHPLTLEQRILAYCHRALEFAGKMTYDDSSRRSELFHRKPGDFAGAHADCSQLGASILHWCGVKTVTDTDYTGTLWGKGKALGGPRSGCGVIFGAYPGQHFGFVEKVGSVFYVIGFGHQAAPDRVSLTDVKAYFERAGHPGVRFIDFG